MNEQPAPAETTGNQFVCYVESETDGLKSLTFSVMSDGKIRVLIFPASGLREGLSHDFSDWGSTIRYQAVVDMVDIDNKAFNGTLMDIQLGCGGIPSDLHNKLLLNQITSEEYDAQIASAKSRLGIPD